MSTERGSWDGGDQGLLNDFFPDWNRLSFTYNVTPSAYYTWVLSARHVINAMSNSNSAPPPQVRSRLPTPRIRHQACSLHRLAQAVAPVRSQQVPDRKLRAPGQPRLRLACKPMVRRVSPLFQPGSEWPASELLLPQASGHVGQSSRQSDSLHATFARRPQEDVPGCLWRKRGRSARTAVQARHRIQPCWG